MSMPVYHWLQFQDINIDNFDISLIEWIFQKTKRNVLIFLRPPNSGKSHIARLYWELFTIHTRLIQDGIFTFANLINSDCALWEEPYITADNADTCKLIMEGEEDVNIKSKILVVKNF